MLLAAQRRAKNAPPIATDAISFAVPRFHSFFLYLCILHLPFCIFRAASPLHLHRLRIDCASIIDRCHKFITHA